MNVKKTKKRVLQDKDKSDCSTSNSEIETTDPRKDEDTDENL